MPKDIPWDQVFGLLLVSGVAIVYFTAIRNYVMGVTKDTVDNPVHIPTKEKVGPYTYIDPT